MAQTFMHNREIWEPFNSEPHVDAHALNPSDETSDAYAPMSMSTIFTEAARVLAKSEIMFLLLSFLCLIAIVYYVRRGCLYVLKRISYSRLISIERIDDDIAIKPKAH